MEGSFLIFWRVVVKKLFFYIRRWFLSALGENSKLEKLQCKIGFYLSSNAANNFCAKILSACKKTLEYSLRIKSALIFHKSLDLSRYDLSKLQMHEPCFWKLSHSDQKS